jgi:hypothetical protein
MVAVVSNDMVVVCGLRMVSKILSRGGREEDSVLQKCEMETMESIDMRRGLTTMF